MKDLTSGRQVLIKMQQTGVRIPQYKEFVLTDYCLCSTLLEANWGAGRLNVLLLCHILIFFPWILGIKSISKFRLCPSSGNS